MHLAGPQLRPRLARLDGAAATVVIMSTADGWDLTVPEDEAELLAELRRHGVKPGQRLHVVLATGQVSDRSDETPERKARRDMPFIGSAPGGPSDLAAKADDYLRQGFGR